MTSRKSSGKILQLTAFLQVISDENRLRILHYLGDGERCVCEIWPSMHLPQNLVSHHLRVLKEAGLVRSRKVGLKVFYSLQKTNLRKRTLLLHKSLSPNE